ncbi:MAG: hypothetical protein MRZ79_13075 [Bacteroidia bacterium]|nr:hypothetical protein [Bacteroidia bacterium]
MNPVKHIILLILIFPNCYQAFGQQSRFLLPPQIHEASGLIALNEDSLLWINDSGNDPVIFITDIKGKLVDSIYIKGIRNKDWEELSMDNKGNVIIGDIGNNCRCREDLRFYLWNLYSGELDSMLYSYQKGIWKENENGEIIPDMEGFYWYNDSLHLFSKGNIWAKEYEQVHYALLTNKKVQVAKALSFYTFAHKRVVTGAAIRKDGKEIAILAYTFRRFLGLIPYSKAEVYLYTDVHNHQIWTGKEQVIKLKPRIVPTQYEAIDYLDRDRIIVGSERTKAFKGQGKIIEIKRAK